MRKINSINEAKLGTTIVEELLSSFTIKELTTMTLDEILERVDTQNHFEEDWQEWRDSGILGLYANAYAMLSFQLDGIFDELEVDLDNEKHRADVEYDRAENYKETLENIHEGTQFYLDGIEYKAIEVKDLVNEETFEVDDNEYQAILIERLETYQESERELEGIKETSRELKTAYERLNMGVLSEIDTIIELTNKLKGACDE